MYVCAKCHLNDEKCTCPKPDHIAFKHGYKVGDRVQLGESVAYVTEIIDDFSFKHSADPPDRIAELRAKWTISSGGQVFGLAYKNTDDGKYVRAGHLNSAAADINELLDMLEKQKVDFDKFYDWGSDKITGLKLRIKDLKAELAARHKRPFMEIDRLEADLGDSKYINEKLRRKIKGLKAELEEKEDTIGVLTRSQERWRIQNDKLKAELKAKGKEFRWLHQKYANALEAKDSTYSPTPGMTIPCRSIDGELWCRVSHFERLKNG